jgi:general secretion pathway protein L
MTTFTHLVSRFFTWWFAELAACLPSGVRSLFRRQPTIFEIGLADDAVQLRLLKGTSWRELGRVLLHSASPSEPRWAFAAAVRGVNLRRAEIVVVLPADRVLQRVVDLPMVAAENLREVLAFEMDRNTPFRADEVAFDYRVTGTDPIAKRIAVDLTVVPRTLIERTTAVTEVFGVTPDRVAIAGSGAADSAMNLLPSAERSGRGRFARRLSVALTIVAFVLVVAAIYLPLHEKRHMLTAYEVRLAESRVAALEADALKEGVAAALERTRFLVDRRLSTPTTAALLNDVSERLPDDTWLIQLRVDGNQLTLSGFSPTAASLIAGLEDSPMLSEVRFGSPVTVDPRVGRERFNLFAVVTAAPGS